jgi:hypothetical protein
VSPRAYRYWEAGALAMPSSAWKLLRLLAGRPLPFKGLPSPRIFVRAFHRRPRIVATLSEIIAERGRLGWTVDLTARALGVLRLSLLGTRRSSDATERANLLRRVDGWRSPEPGRVAVPYAVI